MSATKSEERDFFWPFCASWMVGSLKDPQNYIVVKGGTVDSIFFSRFF